jgi:hypothetical protein
MSEKEYLRRLANVLVLNALQAGRAQVVQSGPKKGRTWDSIERQQKAAAIRARNS